MKKGGLRRKKLGRAYRKLMRMIDDCTLAGYGWSQNDLREATNNYEVWQLRWRKRA